MSTPTVDAARAVCWCRTCSNTSSAPGWAEAHHQKTGHQTSRRSWRIETWRSEKPTEQRGSRS